MNKKGFTLIELLAVIIILAIIALIVVPIVINLIDDVKRESIEIGAKNYIDAVKLSISNKKRWDYIRYTNRRCSIKRWIYSYG